MAIPRQDLNIDPEGYAGHFSGGFNLPKFKTPKMDNRVFNLLKEQMKMRQKLAEAQLKMMKAEAKPSSTRAYLSNPNPRSLTTAERLAMGPRHSGRSVTAVGPEELGRSAASTLDPGNRLGRTAEDFRKLGIYMQFLGPQGVAHTTGIAGQGFADMGRQASANAPALAAMQGPDALQNPYGYGQGSPTAPLRSPSGNASGYRWQTNQGGTMLPSTFKKGTLPGTVPKTGNYQLHKGEIVISEPQVDAPLLNALIADKLRKGITKKNPKGSKGYAAGSLDYRAFQDRNPTVEEIMALQSDPEMPYQHETQHGPSGLGYLTNPQYGKDVMASDPGYLQMAKRFFMGEGGPATMEHDPGYFEMAKRAIGSALGPAEVNADIVPGEQPVEDLADMPLPEEEMGDDSGLELALSRVRGGDLGTPENPLTLTGEPDDRPMGTGDDVFAPESQEWRETQHQKIMETTSQMKADRIRNYLLDDKNRIDPDTRRELLTEMKFLDTMSADQQKQRDQRKALREELTGRAYEAQSEYEQEKVKAEAKGEEMTFEAQQKHIEKMRDNYDEMQQLLVDPKYADSQDRILRTMAQQFRTLAKIQGEDISEREAMLMVQVDNGLLTEEEAEEMAAREKKKGG